VNTLVDAMRLVPLKRYLFQTLENIVEDYDVDET